MYILIILLFLFGFFSGSLFGRFLGYGVCFITSINVAVSFIFSLLIFYDVSTTGNIYQIFLISWIISEFIIFITYFIVSIWYLLYLNNIFVVGTLLNSFKNVVSVLVIKALTTIIRHSNCNELQEVFLDYSLTITQINYLIIFLVVIITNVIIVGVICCLDIEKVIFMKTFKKVFMNEPFLNKVFIVFLTLFISIHHYLFLRGSSEKVYDYYYLRYPISILGLLFFYYVGGDILLLYYVGIVVCCLLFVFPYEYSPSFHRQVNTYLFITDKKFKERYLIFFFGNIF